MERKEKREEKELLVSSIDFFFQGFPFILFYFSLDGRVKYSIIHPSFVTNGVYLDIIKNYIFLYNNNKKINKRLLSNNFIVSSEKKIYISINN